MANGRPTWGETAEALIDLASDVALTKEREREIDSIVARCNAALYGDALPASNSPPPDSATEQDAAIKDYLNTSGNICIATILAVQSGAIAPTQDAISAFELGLAGAEYGD